MASFRIAGLPDDPLAASAAFYAEVVLEVLAELEKPLPFRGGVGGGACPATATIPDMPHPNPSPEGEGLECLTLIFPPASHPHRDWRKAAIATLAREKAPVRINGIASDDEAAIAAALAYLERTEGITGQYLPLDGAGAGSVIG